MGESQGCEVCIPRLGPSCGMDTFQRHWRSHLVMSGSNTVVTNGTLSLSRDLSRVVEITSQNGKSRVESVSSRSEARTGPPASRWFSFPTSF